MDDASIRERGPEAGVAGSLRRSVDAPAVAAPDNADTDALSTLRTQHSAISYDDAAPLPASDTAIRSPSIAARADRSAAAACHVFATSRGFHDMLDHPAQETAAARDARFVAEALCWLPEVTRFARILAGNDPDGDDLAQETFLRAYRFWGSYTPGTDCRRWLITICRNLHRTRVLREAVIQPVGDDADLETLAAVRSHQRAREAGIDHVFEQVELGSAIHDAIAALSEAHRVVVQLIDVEGMSYEDVAAALDVPIGTVRSRLFRARRVLQEALIQHARDAGFVTARAIDEASRAAGGSRSEIP